MEIASVDRDKYQHELITMSKRKRQPYLESKTSASFTVKCCIIFKIFTHLGQNFQFSSRVLFSFKLQKAFSPLTEFTRINGKVGELLLEF